MFARSTFRTHTARHVGFSFVEVLVTAALVSLVFGGLFASVHAMINLIGNSKAKAGAIALATERMEFIRALDYESVGTVGGVPNGLIPPVSTTTLNSITYNERVLVEYVDDDADGFGAADSNGILADYKRVKVEYSWQQRGASSTLSLVSTIPPVGIESTAGGGTIRVNVFDAAVQPVAGAAVRFVNNTTTSTIDTIRYTDTAGIVYLAGAPAAANYHITATRSGYSTDGTTAATTSIPNPTTPPIAVVGSSISTMNFAIDRLSDFTLEILGLATSNQFSDTFTTDTAVASSSTTTLASEAYQLELVGSTFAPSGTLRSVAVAPSPLAQWYAARHTASTTASTSVAISVLYFDGSQFVPIPDADLPGNSTGFSDGVVDLQSVSATTYDTLALAAALTTVDGSETPQLHEWSLEYIESQSSVANVDFSLMSQKVIGTDGAGEDVPKVLVTAQTDGAGEYQYDDIEWGAYNLTVTEPGMSIVEQCPPNPIVINPDDTVDVSVRLGSSVADYLHVVVTDSGGTTIEDASVRLYKNSVPYDRTQTTSLCGQTTFSGGGLVSGGGYELTVSAPGYTTQVINGVNVSATSTETVILN